MERPRVSSAGEVEAVPTLVVVAGGNVSRPTTPAAAAYVKQTHNMAHLFYF